MFYKIELASWHLLKQRFKNPKILKAKCYHSTHIKGIHLAFIHKPKLVISVVWYYIINCQKVLNDSLWFGVGRNKFYESFLLYKHVYGQNMDDEELIED